MINKTTTKKKIATLVASLALGVGGVTVAPVVDAAPIKSADAFTCVYFGNYPGGYSKADGCRYSRYKELIKGRWKHAKWAYRGHVSGAFTICYNGWQRSSYNRIV